MTTSKTVKAVRVPSGREVRLESEIEFGKIAELCNKHGQNWLFALGSPELGTGAITEGLYRLACETAGETPPSPLTASVLTHCFVDVPEDLPEFYEDNAPKTGAQTTD